MERRMPRIGIVLAALAAASLYGGCSRRVPRGWKVSQDATRACEVATPPDWQLGREFFLQRENAETLKGQPGRFPPRGLKVWGIERRDPNEFPQIPPGKRFQVRTSVVQGDGVCSVWRIKQAANFTEAEKSTMRQVGKTLRWLQ